MGALHAGHAKLMEVARQESDVVVVSIFVNPLQFAPDEDYSRYPRALPADLEICSQKAVDLVFNPEVEDLYPSRQLTFVEVTHISEHLCGAFRPGHFRGVATVVLKLFNIVQPHCAYFGEKDLQQLAVIRRMVMDLNLPVAIKAVPTVREPDGMALSSRNRYLDGEQRKIAARLYQALVKARHLVDSGERDPLRVCAKATETLREAPGIRIEYFDVVDPVDMQPVTDVISGPVRIAGAIWVGNTRLIDNL
jgi:pantoate--beta-alanine ligase